MSESFVFWRMGLGGSWDRGWGGVSELAGLWAGLDRVGAGLVAVGAAWNSSFRTRLAKIRKCNSKRNSYNYYLVSS